MEKISVCYITYPDDQINLTFNLTILQICRNCKQNCCCKYSLLMQTPNYGKLFPGGKRIEDMLSCENLCKRRKDSWTAETTVT
jgi:hypothetical protein